MGKSERAFTFINTKSVGNVERRVNKGSDMPALVKSLKHRHLLTLLHVTVILSNIRTKFCFFCFASIYAIKYLLILQIQMRIHNSMKHRRWSILGI